MVDEFIGTRFGNLTVVGWDGERQGNGTKLYECHCSECAQDPELHGNAIYKSPKDSLVRGQLPCGCSKNPRWNADQYRVLIKRKSNIKYSVVVPEGAKATTKVRCICAVEDCGHEWSTTINKLLNNGTACQKCGGRARGRARTMPESVAIENVLRIANEKGWTLLGFKTKWKNAHSKLLLECSRGHTWDPSYTGIVHGGGTGCPDCNGGGYNRSLPGTFYVYLWTHKDTKAQHLKYGISNVPTNRIRNQRRANAKYTAKQLCSIDFTDGNIPANLEKVVDEYKKASQIPSPVTKEIFPDGFSETLPITEWSFIANLVFQTTMCRITPIQPLQ